LERSQIRNPALITTPITIAATLTPPATFTSIGCKQQSKSLFRGNQVGIHSYAVKEIIGAPANGQQDRHSRI
jgi:hypothetical protein